MAEEEDRARKVKAASHFLARAQEAMSQAEAAGDPDAIEELASRAEGWLDRARRCLGEPAVRLRARTPPREGRSFKLDD